ncbi:MAG TPA: double-strand break repair helicase AddA [Alphaproteobacteria bacterium]|nr:double-strand break repair helicase AddA [Alphaproteobacteria bacterium]
MDELDALSPIVVQRRASDPEASVWVGASAGTGKTRVLTDRVLRLMLAGTAPDKILCLTFTKAAASEMANRIHRTLAGWATMADDRLVLALDELCGERPSIDRQKLARQLFARVLDAPGGMKIQTIHAFCQSLLRRFPLEAGLPPHFTLMDDFTATELLAEVRNGLLQNPPLSIASAIRHVTGLVTEDAFAELMAELTRERGRLAQLIETHGGADGLADEVYRHLGIDREETEAGIVAAACEEAAFEAELLKRAAASLLDGTKTDVERGKALAAWLENADGRIDGFDAYCGQFLTLDGDIRKVLMTKGPASANPDLLDALLAEAKRLEACLARCKAAAVAEATAALFSIAEAMVDLYRQEKERRALLDYDDLILTTASLLKDPGVAWVLFKLDGGIDHVLIDEAQDTNPDQWQVVAVLAEEFFAGMGARDGARTLFAVGDEKQSIFSFQRADPAEFARMRSHFERRIREARQDWRTVELETSFRSTAAVLTVVDAVFAAGAPARDGVGLDPQGILRHLPFRRGEGGLVELWPPFAPTDALEPAPWSLPVEQVDGDDPCRRLAVRVAQTIRDWIDNGEMLEAKGRPIHPGDVLVLVRTRDRFFVELVRALKERDVPVAGVDRMVLTEQLAIMDLMALADFLLLPEDDLTLATVLKGPLIGLDEDQLFAAAHDRGRQTLWSALGARADRDPAFRAARNWLGTLLARVDFIPPYELFAGLLAAPCPGDPISGRRAMLGRLGPEAEDPVEEFLGLALAYEANHPPSLQRFLHWLRIGEAEVKRELEAAARKQVRIMTVHGSKGLQAPIVFLPDTMGVPTKSPPILWPDGSMPVPLWAPSRKREEARCSEARARANRRRDQEYRRLLYVALTRAEDRLYICGHHGRGGPGGGCWYELCGTGLAALEGVERIVLPGFEAPALRYRVPQTKTAVTPPAGGPQADVQAAPAWLRQPAPAEPEPTVPLTPSRPDGEEPPVRSPLGPDDGHRFRRGRLIHALLQTLPDLDTASWNAAATRFLSRSAPELDPASREEIVGETLAVLRDSRFSALFGPGSRAEAPIVGLIRGKALSGQIDRLLVTDEEVLIVDYKTHRPPPLDEAMVPGIYLRQMAAYRAALAGIYPGRRVVCALLWTDGPRLMPLSETLLDRHAP